MPEHQGNPTASLEIWALIDEDGSYVVDANEENLAEKWDDEIGGTPLNSRTVKLTLTVPLPRGIDVSAVLPDVTDGETAIAVTVEG